MVHGLLRVPLLKQNSSNSSGFGISSNMIFLMWSVCGGFLLYFFKSNYLSMLIKPAYEKPVDSAEDIISRGLKIVGYPDQEGLFAIEKERVHLNLL